MESFHEWSSDLRAGNAKRGGRCNGRFVSIVGYPHRMRAKRDFHSAAGKRYFQNRKIDGEARQRNTTINFNDGFYIARLA
ncbi:MAG: hypothetical protein LBE06_00390 [Azoarcus sp.]|jgi:hypothetical protein|nr:hypothetical protein [Azoarcus sp.]